MDRKELLKKAETVLDVDKDRLDDEWVAQPRNVYQFTKALEDARAAADRLKVEVDICKEEVKRTEAEVEVEVRRRPKTFKIDKVTEGAVKAAVVASGPRVAAVERLREAQLALIDAEHEAGVFGAVCKGLENKKKALEDLVVLQGRAYFADPKPPKDTNHRMEEVDKRANRRTGAH